MPKVRIYEDEWYPVYTVDESHRYLDHEIEVDEKTLKRWDRVTNQFIKIQEEMRKAKDEAH